MTAQAFIRAEIINGEQLDVTDIRCPNCQQNTLVLSGKSLLPCRELMKEGVIVERVEGKFEEGSFDLQQIDCFGCNTTFVIRDQQLYELEAENLELKKTLANLGHPVEGYGQVN